MKLLAIPNDPLNNYITKGEIKKLYFNPGNIFTKIYFLTFDTENVNISELQYASGGAEICLLNWRPLNYLEQLFPQLRLRELRTLVKNLDVDVVRGFSPFYSGFFAVGSTKSKR